MQVTPNTLYQSSAKDTQARSESQVEKNNADSTPKRLTDQLYERFAENQVNVSDKAKKLSAISQKYFSGVIRSQDIPALKQALFEEGFVSDKDYTAMGGNPTKVRAVKQAIDFTRGYSATIKDKDAEAFKGMQTVLKALQNLQKPNSDEKQKTEKNAIDFLVSYTKKLKNEGAKADVQASIKSVLEQLQASTKLNPKNIGAVSSYADIQNAN